MMLAYPKLCKHIVSKKSLTVHFTIVITPGGQIQEITVNGYSS